MGYATEALKGWMKMYWQTWPREHPTIANEEKRGCLTAMTGAEDGVPSRRVLEKCGFRHDRHEEEREDDGGALLEA